MGRWWELGEATTFWISFPLRLVDLSARLGSQAHTKKHTCMHLYVPTLLPTAEPSTTAGISCGVFCRPGKLAYWESGTVGTSTMIPRYPCHKGKWPKL